ncbi:CLAVATA3/ESR (CLE)-related protein 27 [Argentina anserina]|uniref:CLAVATA3/ESR (CLE)-related protein 27 n=1 Tax=Argentina anserina TaxID=57926 RepID=UPI00217640F4|nr:CLAVATA3/ESR (CLE)-related protein 27 [Potentilla anserina]
MSFAGGRRRRQFRYSSLAVVLIVMSVLQIWVCSDDRYCRAGAIRVLPPPDGNVNQHHHLHVSSDHHEEHGKKKASKEELFRKFFSGISSASKFNSTDKGFEDSKRRVPSCPDPLHN